MQTLGLLCSLYKLKKILQAKTWKAWGEMSPVGFVAWLARKQLIPNAGFSFFVNSDSTVARSMAVLNACS